MITKEMRVSHVLQQYPDTLEIFIKASPHFSKLKNKILRKALAGRVTVEQAAKIGGVDLYNFLFELNKAINQLPDNFEKMMNRPKQEEELGTNKPEFLINAERGKIKELDVRPIIDEGKDPLSTIMNFVKNIADDEIFLLINSFEPLPLYTVLGNKGFEHFTEKVDNTFKVYFYKTGKEHGIKEDKANQIDDTFAINLSGYENVIEINVRELPPPEPMMKVFETLPRVDENTLLLVHHHREPLMLYPKLEERGYRAQSNKIEENYYKVFIVKK
ncbi:MAG: DUF2249 domain-containing protein [Melioribacteraceae bacterium]|nr:MAG: DUF2249 domain-containing protein [Melioribacteraceae bacterium]